MNKNSDVSTKMVAKVYENAAESILSLEIVLFASKKQAQNTILTIKLYT